jgi:hypothetical protein
MKGLGENEVPEHDPRFQSVSQTSHEITDTEVVFVYTVADKSLEQIKTEYKTGVAPERWNKENNQWQLSAEVHQTIYL